ncbi:S-adenosyl-L-methionine-dependent methyltransferase [Lasiosphaeria hispida]|uniref:S-adenosyl-L-methionine-dependent methyltransferase n=1 Tax=Lasiosphaeria hispida TaxID=260671 RepID=A0AAJ0MIN9_9PEZI|nr:S-adenosyl-L-methionine-dependent methyltransferase [Lasiosphaeria hispida]
MDPLPHPPTTSTAAMKANEDSAADAGILPAEHWSSQLGISDDKSLFDSDKESTKSLYPSIFKYRTIRGRTYHPETTDAQYWATNDRAQAESLNINHHCFTLALAGKLFLAPLNKKTCKTALDIGTGTGIWAIDFAEEFRQATVTATDITPVTPSYIPPNLTFEIEDCNKIWAFPNDHFDYIHIRWLIGSVTDWDRLFERAFDHMRVGGWLESYETSAMVESDDGSVTETSALGQWGKIFIEGGRKFGMLFTVVQDGTQRTAMERAGFVDIQERDIKMPIGSWPTDDDAKEQGTFTQAALEQDVEGYILFMAETLGWTRRQVLIYVKNVKREMRSKKYHAYYKQKVVWGRKPEKPVRPQRASTVSSSADTIRGNEN